MPMIYKSDILEMLKIKGFNTYKLMKMGIIGQGTIQKLRNKQSVSWNVLETLCKLLDCQPGDILEYVPDE